MGFWLFDMQRSPSHEYSDRRLQVFLCHSSADKPLVRKLYHRLHKDGFRPWLDEEDLIPGLHFQEKIEEAIDASHVVVICLSRNSVNKEGFVQREIKYALDVANEKPRDALFVVPLKFDDCDLPRYLKELHWADLFPRGGYGKLVHSLKTRAAQVGLAVPAPIEGLSKQVRRSEQYGDVTGIHLSMEFPKLVKELTAIVGNKLTAYIASVKDTRTVDKWISGAEPNKGAQERLRLAYRLAKMIGDHDGPRIVQAWLTGLNPELDDRVPIRLLREGSLEAVGPEILTAARAFLAGG